jgi:hypothetical protein
LEQQRDGIELLAKIAECLLKECESWTSNIQALSKAKQMEEKALKAAQDKAKKAEAKAIEKQRKKEAAKREKEAKEAAKETHVGRRVEL